MASRVISRSKIFIFGFGSLISARSRAVTIGETPATPCIVRGLQREFNVRIPYQNEAAKSLGLLGVTALGCRTVSKESTTTICNGVLIEVQPEQLSHLDVREGVGVYYSRVELNGEDICITNGKGEAQSSAVKRATLGSTPTIYAYVTLSASQPTPQYPVIQSYVDVFLSGALELSEEYIKTCIDTTGNWGGCSDESKDDSNGGDDNNDTDSGCESVHEGSWLNDRARPVYVRTDIKAASIGGAIDDFLHIAIPSALKLRKDAVKQG